MELLKDIETVKQHIVMKNYHCYTLAKKIVVCVMV